MDYGIDTIATDIKVTTIQPGIVETDFSKVRFHGDEERAATVYQGLEALQAQDIADTVVYVTSQPRRVPNHRYDHHGQSTSNWIYDSQRLILFKKVTNFVTF